MMKHVLYLLVSLHTFLSVASSGDLFLENVEKDPVQSNCQLECLIDVIGFLYNDPDNTVQSTRDLRDDLFLCRLRNDPFPSRSGYRVFLPVQFVEANRAKLSSATTIICISSGEVDRVNRRVAISEDAQISIIQRRQLENSLNRIVGTRSILAVKLTTNFINNNVRQIETPQMTESEIEGAIFGTGPDSPGHDLTSQYRDCSFGKLNLIPATGNGNIENGVVEVRLRKRIAEGEILGSLQDEILEATEERVGSLDQFDHIIYCIPDDALMDGAAKWTAFTYFHSHWSFFQRRRCSAMSVTIHELGHNLGFRHSGHNADAYGDESGYMGFTIYQQGGPVKCFNGHKNWVAGWFRDRQLRVVPSMPEPVLAQLVTFVDYNKLTNLHTREVVVIRIGHYFIQYNRAKGINIDTGMHADKVSITYAKDSLSDSEAVAGLSDGESVQIPRYRGTGHTLVVEVCRMGSSSPISLTANAIRQANFGDPNGSSSSLDFAWVSIHLDNGMQRSQCGRLNRPQNLQSPQPTSKPTLRPSLPPSLPPIRPPTSAPTTQLPTSKPTTEATLKPTEKTFPGAVAPSRKHTIDFSVQERIQKRTIDSNIKVETRLIKNSYDAKPGVRRNLKGSYDHNNNMVVV